MPERIRRGLIFGRSVHHAFQQYRRKFSRLRRPPTLAERAEWLHEACRRCLRALDIRVHAEGEMPPDGLIVSNHLSYLDILCFSSIAPCVFVSKAEVRKWPVFGRLATNGGTIYIDRESKADAHRVATQIEHALRERVRVVLFPEGTSSDGSQVLRFHAPLFESAVRAGSTITPAGLRYEMKGGDPAQDVCYWGDMTFGAHFLRLLSKGGVTAQIMVGAPALGFKDRKEASSRLRSEVATLHQQLLLKYPGGLHRKMNAGSSSFGSHKLERTD